MEESTRSWPDPKRAVRYREQAQNLRDMAAAEPVGSLRESLLALSRQYDALADSIEAKGQRQRRGLSA